MKLRYISFVLLLLSACGDVNPPSYPAPSFRHFQPIYFKASTIEVIEEYRQPMRAPNIEHLMPYAPADAMQIWVKQRMKASGGGKTMQVIIKDASVIEKKLPTKGGIAGLITVEQDKEYNARLEVEIRVYGDAALSEASVNVIATRMMTMSEAASVADRNSKFQQLLKDMMATTNAELEKNIHQYLSNYVDYSRAP
jgi:hypothetical protein